MTAMRSLLLLAMFTAACGGGESDVADTASEAMEMAEQAGGMATMAAVNEPMALDETDMERLVGALEALKRTGEKYEGRTDGSSWSDFGAGVAANAEAMAILREHGYASPQAFQRVVYNVGAAMAAAELRGQEEQMAQARQKMEAMKGQMSEEQYKAMMQTQQGAMSMVSDQPEGNVELVQAWKDRIEAAVQD